MMDKRRSPFGLSGGSPPSQPQGKTMMGEAPSAGGATPSPDIDAVQKKLDDLAKILMGKAKAQ